MDMEYLVMNYSDEEDVFPSEDGAESNHFTSRTPKLADDAMQEDMEILNTSVVRTFGFPGARSPCDFKGAPGNNNESPRNQIEDDENIEVISNEGNSKDVVSSIIVSNVKTVVDEQDCLMLCKSSTKATSPISPTFVEDGTNTEKAMNFDNSEYHSGSGYPISSKVDEESDRENEATDDLESSKSHNVFLIKKDKGEESAKETPAAANFPFSPSSLVGQDADLETSIDLVEGEIHSTFTAKSEREDEESGKENSTAATLANSFNYSGEQEANTPTVIDLGSIKNHNLSLIKDEENEESDKGNSTVATLPISSSSLHGQLAIAAAAIDFDSSKNHNIFLIEDKEHKQVDKESSTAVPSPILSIPLVRLEADMQTVVVSDNPENHCVSPVSSDDEDTESNEDNSAAATPNSTKSLVGHGADTQTAMGSDSRESCRESLITGQEGEESDKENSPAVVRNPVNSTHELSERQPEISRQFEANGCDTRGKTLTSSQKYQDNPVISDRRTFKCKLCSYSSTIRFGLKRHMLTHSENSDLNEATKRLSSHLVVILVRHKNEKSKCNICDTFVPAHLKEKHLLKCRTKKNVFECKKCQFNTIHARMFVRHQRECGNKRRYIPRQSETSGGNCGKLEKSKQRGKINEPSKQLHRCEYCSYSAKQKNHLKAHTLAHTVFNRPIYRCSACDYKSFRRNLIFHMMTHSLSPETQQLKSCNFCSFTTKTEAQLEKHVILHTVHNRPIYRCPKCDYKSTKINFSKHVKTAHKIGTKHTSSAKTKGLKKCDFCSYITKYGRDMIRHRQLHIEKKKPIVSCTKCDYKAPRVTLFFHNMTVHGSRMDENEEEQVHTCTFCSFTTHIERSLRKHTRLHTVHNRPVYRCPKCDYKSTKRLFFKHVKIAHKTESKNIICSLPKTKRLKKCDFCSYSTDLNHLLMRHRHLHTLRNKPIFSCTRCDYKAPRYTLFYHYKNVHGGHQSLVSKCTFCSYTTPSEAQLEEHILLHTVHNRPIYHCPKCEYKSTKLNLAKHVKAIHKIQSINTESLKKTHTGRQAVALSKKNIRGAKAQSVQKWSKPSNNKTNENEGEETLERPQKLESNTKTKQQLVYLEYSCELCSFTTKFESNLNRHLHRAHKQEQRISKQSNSYDLDASGIGMFTKKIKNILKS